MTLNIVVNPFAGNEPYIMGANIADHISTHLKTQGKPSRIIVPHTHGKLQEKILGPEELDIQGEVILDPKLGELYRGAFFPAGDYRPQVDFILNGRRDFEQAIIEHLRDNYGNVHIDLAMGSRITLDAMATYYAFPVIVSELLYETAGEKGLNQFDDDKLLAAMEEMFFVESDHSLVFLPFAHTFSFDGKDGIRERINSSLVHTPPLKPVPQKDTRELPQGAIYLMPSGTGSEVEEIFNRARRLLEQEIPVVMPDWGGGIPEDLRARVIFAGPEVFSNDNISRVIARAGWGTLWTAQQAGAYVEALPYQQPDDPEIYFNLKTLRTKGLFALTEKQRTLFPHMDGLKFVADAIIRNLSL